MLNRLVWDFVPYKFLYDLYKAWFKANCPSGMMQGRNTFIKDLKLLLADSQEWNVKANSIPSDGHFGEPEMLIEEYNLTNWINKNYTGNDRARRCIITPSSSYRGIERIKH